MRDRAGLLSYLASANFRLGDVINHKFYRNDISCASSQPSSFLPVPITLSESVFGITKAHQTQPRSLEPFTSRL